MRGREGGKGRAQPRKPSPVHVFQCRAVTWQHVNVHCCIITRAVGADGQCLCAVECIPQMVKRTEIDVRSFGALAQPEQRALELELAHKMAHESMGYYSAEEVGPCICTQHGSRERRMSEGFFLIKGK